MSRPKGTIYTRDYLRKHAMALPDRARAGVTYNESLRNHGPSSLCEAFVKHVSADHSAGGVEILIADDPKFSNSTFAHVWLTEKNLRACLFAIEGARETEAGTSAGKTRNAEEERVVVLVTKDGERLR